MNALPFLAFPMQVIVKENEAFVPKYIESLEEYKVFLRSRESLTSFSESNIEVQNISNMLNIDIHCFSYGRKDCNWTHYSPISEVVGFSEWAYPTNDQQNTIVLYHQKGVHFEVIVPRSQTLPFSQYNFMGAPTEAVTSHGEPVTSHGEPEASPEEHSRKRRRSQETIQSSKSRKLSDIFEQEHESSTLADGEYASSTPLRISLRTPLIGFQ